MRTSSHTPPPIVTEAAAFIGIDYHKKYSVWHAIDAAGSDLGKGSIEHHSPHDFSTLVKRWPNPRVVFEASMNWHWLDEELEQHMPAAHLTLAKPGLEQDRQRRVPTARTAQETLPGKHDVFYCHSHGSRCSKPREIKDAAAFYLTRFLQKRVQLADKRFAFMSS